LKPRLNHGAAPELFEAAMPLLSTATWAAVEQALAGNEAAARASFDGIREVLADFDQMHAHYAPAAERRSLVGRLSARLGSLRPASRRM
jgi:hypothetical protein